MANDVSLVSAGKPKIAGAVYRAPAGTTPPTDATTNLASAFVLLGYVSEEGLTNNPAISSTDIKAWGGDTVLTTMDSVTDDFQLTLLESMNTEVLKTFYGNTNVTGTLTGTSGITVTVNSKDLEYAVYSVDMALRDGAVKRIVIPSAKPGERANIVYRDNEPIGYNVTLRCTPDSAGNTHYEYIKKTA